MAFVGVLGFAFGALAVLAIVLGAIYGLYLGIRVWFNI